MITKRAVTGWILYDLANTIFSMGVVSTNFSLYVREEVGGHRADSIYGLITAVSMGIIFLVSPLLGAMTDRAPRRMPFLVGSTLLCCACTALLARGPFAVSAVLFIIANAAYQAGVQFYDAMLPEVTTEENRGRIGGIGVGVGYVGSYIAVGVGLLLRPMNYPLYFTIVAVLFALFALPCMLFVRERGNPNPRPVVGRGVIAESTKQTLETLRQGQRYPGLLRFLVGRVFYTDAVNTVIVFMSLYAINVAISVGLRRGGRRAPGEVHHALCDQLRSGRRVRVGLGRGPDRPETHAEHRAAALDGDLRDRVGGWVPAAAHRSSSTSLGRSPDSASAGPGALTVPTCCASPRPIASASSTASTVWSDASPPSPARCCGRRRPTSPSSAAARPS